MYCRTCGNKVNDNAEICIKCGCKPLIGKVFCQSCRAETTSQQQLCTKCGVRLRTIMAPAHKKQVGKNNGLKILGNVLSVIGILLFIGAVINIIVGLTEYHPFLAMEHYASAGNCIMLGTLPFVLGIIYRKKAKKK